MNYIAHTDGSRTHDLLDHLNAVASATSDKLKYNNLDTIGEQSGFLHDLGKYRTNFQNYLKQVSGLDPSAVYDPNNKTHASAGMFLTRDKIEDPVISSIIQYVIGCHHSGLLDITGVKSINSRFSDPKYQLEYSDTMDNVPSEVSERKFKHTRPNIIGKTDTHKILSLSLATRITFSAMVDSDWSDTANWMGKGSKHKAKYSSIEELRNKLEDHYSKFDDITGINTIRNQVANDCLDSASMNRGVFTLSVPTGGGKTLAGIRFALNHAVKHGMRRIIVAIPYTSIIEQTAKIYKDIFGEHNVLEHHMNIDKVDRLLYAPHLQAAQENWDAPIIVTTNVQLFESLFSSQPFRCRKVHNIQNSVIILDEVQTIPIEYTKSSYAYLRLLNEDYGCSVVFSTATQPIVSHISNAYGNTKIWGFDTTEIIKDVTTLYSSLKRVEINMLGKLGIQDIAYKVENHNQVLCIVNTRKNAAELFCSITGNHKYHLSSAMCAAHRKVVLDEVRQRLNDNLPVVLISTQVVEAGVDIDFPVVYRAMIGLDSIAQAAGRCNRHGTMLTGIVYVMEMDETLPPDMIRPQYATRRAMKSKKWNNSDVIGVDNIKLYYSCLYDTNEIMDKKIGNKTICDLLSPSYATVDGKKTYGCMYETVSDNYCIVDGSNKSTVYVLYGKADYSWYDGTEETAWKFKYWQSHAVTIFDNKVDEMDGIIVPIEHLHKSYYMVDPSFYSETGL